MAARTRSVRLRSSKGLETFLGPDFSFFSSRADWRAAEKVESFFFRRAEPERPPLPRTVVAEVTPEEEEEGAPETGTAVSRIPNCLSDRRLKAWRARM